MLRQGSTQLTDSRKKITIEQACHAHLSKSQFEPSRSCSYSYSEPFSSRQERDKEMRVEEKRLTKVKEEAATEDAKLKKVCKCFTRSTSNLFTQILQAFPKSVV